MKTILFAGFAAALALAGCTTAQQPGVSEQDHQAHHPAGTATPAPAQGARQPGAGPGMGQGAMGTGMMGPGMMGSQGQGMMGQGMMGGQGQGMMGGGQGMTDLCPMMSGARSPEEHKSMFQQRLKNMSPEQVRQMMSMMETHMSMMQGDIQMMQDHLAKQPR